MTAPTTIDRPRHVAAFFGYLYDVEQVSFHPDDSFADTVSRATGQPTFSPERAALLDKLMEDCFAVCERADIDIYAIGNAAFRIRYLELFNN